MSRSVRWRCSLASIERSCAIAIAATVAACSIVVSSWGRTSTPSVHITTSPCAASPARIGRTTWAPARRRDAVARGEHRALGVADRDRAPDELGHRLGQLGERAAVDGDLREPGVDRARALELDRLAVEDRPEHLGEDVVEHRPRREADHGERERVGQRRDVGGDRVEVEPELDHEARELALGQRRDEPRERADGSSRIE